jgi:Tol biopolymer transport system component
VLVYSPWRRPPSQLTWMDRTGKSLGAAGAPGYYVNLGLSLDDRHVAVSQVHVRPGAQASVDIWLIDLARAGAASKITDHPAGEFDPAFSADGQRVAFNSSRLDPLRSAYSLFVRPSNGSGQDELLVKSETLITAPDWSPDGGILVYGEQAAATGYDLWTLPLSGERTKSVFLQTAYDEASGTFSPDGRWIAYESNASGRNQVYVRPFPVRDGQFPISRDGGRAPRWSANGKELFFLTPDGMLMAVGIDTTKAFTATVPQPLFRTGLTHAGSFHPYAVAKDGRRFLIPVPHETPGAMPITVVLNWPATLGK